MRTYNGSAAASNTDAKRRGRPAMHRCALLVVAGLALVLSAAAYGSGGGEKPSSGDAARSAAPGTIVMDNGASKDDAGAVTPLAPSGAGPTVQTLSAYALVQSGA